MAQQDPNIRISAAAAAETVTRFDEDGGKINQDDSHFLREVYGGV